MVGERSRRLGARAACLACLTAAAVAQAPGAPQDPTAKRYDPYEGIDRNNRIPKPQLPPDLPNPERWRYTPAGKLPPGSVIDRFLATSFISPLFFREEDIGFGGGIALTDLDFRNLGGLEIANIAASYSEEGQQQFRMDWARWLNHRRLDNGGIIRDERSIGSFEIDYSRTLTRRFFGFGSETPKSAETSYTEELTRIGGGVRLALPEAGSDWIMNASMNYQHHGLQRGRVDGINSTDQDFPALFAAADGVDQLWLTAGLAFDTRDSLHQPYRGWRLGAGVSAAPLQTGGEVGAVTSVDTRGVLPLPPLLHRGGDRDEQNPPTDVLVLGGFVSAASGDLPFYSLPSLGGANTLRGYIQNRFTDRAAAHGTVEYRFIVSPRGFRVTDTVRIERVGLALFYDFGTVANDLGNLLDGEYLDSYGIGARVAFAREAVFRVDFGISEEDSLLTIAFGNNF